MFNGLSTSLLGYGNKKIFIDLVLVCVYSILCLFSHWSVGLFGLSVYFSRRSLTGQWDSVRFIGLFGLSVYFSMHPPTAQWDSVRLIGLFGLSVYFTMHSPTGQWDSVRLDQLRMGLRRQQRGNVSPRGGFWIERNPFHPCIDRPVVNHD